MARSKLNQQKKGVKKQTGKPRNANGEGCVYQCQTGQHVGKWIVQVAIGIGPNGRPKYKKAYCKTHPEAKRKLKEFLKTIEDGIDLQQQAKLTLKDWITTWMDLYRKNSISPSTWQNHIIQLMPLLSQSSGTYWSKI